MRTINHHSLVGTCHLVDAWEDRGTGACTVPPGKLHYSQSRAVQEANVCSSLPINSNTT